MNNESLIRPFIRILTKLKKKRDISYQKICDNLNDKVSIRLNKFPLSNNPFKEKKEEIESLEKLLELGISDIINLEKEVKGKTVFIKPNLNFVPNNVNPFGLTDPRLLFALTRLLHRKGAQRILIGEKPGQKRKSNDSYRLLKKYFDIPNYVEFIEIDLEPHRETKTSTKLVSSILALPESYLLADFIINIPKMKTHTLTGVSLGIKNLFGLLTDEEKMKHHNEDINYKLVDLLSIRTPNLTIIDGLISLEGQGPLYGTPKKSNLLIIGKNCVSVDAVSSYLMGFHPKDIEHIFYAYKMGLGNINIKNIRFPAGNPHTIKTNFKRANPIYNPFTQIKIIKGKNVPSGYLNALSHSLERLKHEKREPKKIKIYIGKFNSENIEENSIVFGDITINSVNQNSGRIITGNPPLAFELYNLLK